MATCHPDREMLARGQCGACYHRTYVRKKPRKKKRMAYHRGGLLGLGALTSLPFQPRPTVCGKCGSGALVSHPERPEVSCRMCGTEVFCRPEAGLAAMREYVLGARQEVSSLFITAGA